jgi:pyrroline-5-carboxylate reductase
MFAKLFAALSLLLCRLHCLMRGLFESFSELLNNYSHPALIKDAVMSPNGVTAKGYAVLEDYKVRSAFIKVYKG